MKKLRRFNTENEYNNIELYHPTVSYVKETTDVHFQEQYWIDAVYLYQGTQTYGVEQPSLPNYISNDVDMFKKIILNGVEIYNDKMNVSFDKEITVSKDSDDWIFYDSDYNETTKENATLFAPKNSLIKSNKVKFENESDVKSIIVLLENGGMFMTFYMTMDAAKEFGFTKNENDEWIIDSMYTRNYNVQIIGLNIEVEFYDGYGLIPIEFFENISPTTLYYVDKSILSLQEKEEPQHARFLLKDGVKKISDGMFSNIPMIDVFIPSVIEEIGDIAFVNSRGLSNITFRGENNVKYIGENAFNNTNITEFDFTDKITYIGESAFNNSNLTNIYISRNIENINDYAFHGCPITEVFIPNNVKYIGDSAFDRGRPPYYETLTSVTFEENSQVEYLGEYFISCSKIKNFTLPKSVTYFGGFNYKDGLETLSVEEGNTVYDSRNNCNCIIETETNKLICGCKSMVLPDTIEIIGLQSINNINITELILPNNVKIIEGIDSSYITKLHIPASVTSINNLSGRYLTSLTIDSGNLVYNDGNGSNCIIETATNKLICGCKSTVIPSGVEIISPRCFYMVSISSITIPNTVTRIEDTSFMACFTKTITFEENSNLTYIGENCFQQSSSITSITIPNSVTEIGSYAFYYCTSLTSVTIPSLITELKESTFDMCSKLSTITCLATTAPTLADNTFNYISSTGTLNVPNGASGYDAWLSVLGEGWSIVEITE